MRERSGVTDRAPRARRLAWLRRPVRREDAERYLFLTLVSFAGTVLATRWFLHLTGFPKIGGGDLHIAHALWGGLVLFAAAVLPILLAGRLVYRAAAILAGIGIGLFIDEVGKFITTQNDYFYPAAAPIIYATFLLAVLVWLRARGPDSDEPRARLLGALELLEESVEGDLQPRERDELLERLRDASSAPREEQRRLAEVLRGYVESRSLVVIPGAPPPFAGARTWWAEREERWLGGRGLRVVIVAALLVSGANALLALLGAAAAVSGDAAVPGTRLYAFNLVHLAVEAAAGAVILVGAVLVALAGMHRLGWTLAYFGLLAVLVLGDLISFYLRQFDSIAAVTLHVVLLAAVVRYRRELAAERAPTGAARVPPA
ncbi:MAG TPA: hypothetical protein VFM19_00325 [Candidatus Limnocylindria bacterium]|nr:hypothetical protein [Candidatus Limnocylindria bacterium]